MAKYNVYSADGTWLGTVTAGDEDEAVKRAKQQDMPTATEAKLRDE